MLFLTYLKKQQQHKAFEKVCKQISADTTYFLPETKLSIVHKPSTPVVEEGVNALNLILQTPPMFSKYTLPHLLTQPQSKYLKNIPSFEISLTVRLQRACNKLFKRIFATWYFKKEINRRVDRFFWGYQILSKKDILFFPQYIVRSNHRRVFYDLNTCTSICSGLFVKILEK